MTDRGGSVWSGAMKSFSQDDPNLGPAAMAALLVTGSSGGGRIKSYSTEEAGRGTHRVRMRSYRR
jgi:hypothetical protein